jgi:hypothetical protein
MMLMVLHVTPWCCRPPSLTGAASPDAIIAIDLDTNLGRPMRVLDHQVGTKSPPMHREEGWGWRSSVHGVV